MITIASLPDLGFFGVIRWWGADITSSLLVFSDSDIRKLELVELTNPIMSEWIPPSS